MRCGCSTPSIVTSPPVTAARPMKHATSMWSGRSRHSPPRSDSTPSMRRTFDSIPSMCAPSETRKRQRSWTCGSHAALPITVSPGASTAAMIVFSVAMTLASSRKTLVPRRPCGAHLEAVADVDLGAELGERVDVGVEAAAADHVAARRRDARRRRHGRAAGRRAGTTRGSGCRAPRRGRACESRRTDAHLVRPGPFHVGADVGEQRDHRVDVADARDVRQRRRALR